MPRIFIYFIYFIQLVLTLSMIYEFCKVKDIYFNGSKVQAKVIDRLQEQKNDPYSYRLIVEYSIKKNRYEYTSYSIGQFDEKIGNYTVVLVSNSNPEICRLYNFWELGYIFVLPLILPFIGLVLILIFKRKI